MGHDRDDVHMILSLSGGGSWAKYFAGLVILRLKNFFPDSDILKQADVISSVSKSSLPAAYFAVSCDRDEMGKEVISAPIRGGISINDLLEQLKTQLTPAINNRKGGST